MSTKPLLLGVAIFLAALPGLCAADTPKISPSEAAQAVTKGSAVLVDVREPGEWADTGVAAPAVLLPKSEFDDGRTGDWKPFLEKNRRKLIILYCRSGKRSNELGSILVNEGYTVANAGGLRDWEAAGLPLRLLSEAKPKP